MTKFIVRTMRIQRGHVFWATAYRGVSRSTAERVLSRELARGYTAELEELGAGGVS